jgi:hypothetical protein
MGAVPGMETAKTAREFTLPTEQRFKKVSSFESWKKTHNKMF